MAMAPVAYTLWQRFLRFDPADPIWPNRDRFVLSAGHASMLLYSLLHLAGVRAVDPDYEVVGEPAVSLDDIKTLPPARLARARPPRVPLDLRGRDDHRPARPGRRDLGRDGDRRRSGRQPASTGPSRALRLRRLRDRRRRLPDGGRLERGRLDRRPPAARQPLLDLRQQPHHDRRPHRPRLQRRRRRPLHGLRLERDPGRRRQRHSSCSPAPSRSSRRRRTARP